MFSRLAPGIHSNVYLPGENRGLEKKDRVLISALRKAGFVGTAKLIKKYTRRRARRERIKDE